MPPVQGDNVIIASADAVPTDILPVTSRGIVSIETFNDTIWQPNNNMIATATAPTSAQLTFNITLADSQWIVANTMDLILQVSLNTTDDYVPTYSSTSWCQDVGCPDAIWGTNPGMWYNFFTNIVVQYNKIPTQEIPTSYFIQRLAGNTYVAPQNFVEAFGTYNYRTFRDHCDGDLHESCFVQQGNRWNRSDMSLWTETVTTDTSTEFVYVRVPLYQFLYPFAEQGRFLTDQTQMVLLFQMTSGAPTFTFVQSSSGTVIHTYGVGAVAPLTSDVQSWNGTTLVSRPVTGTLLNAWIRTDQYVVKEPEARALRNLALSRPLSSHYWDHQIIQDPQIVNIPLLATNVNINTLTNGWGYFAGRNLIRSGALLSKFVTPQQWLKLTWVGGTANPWGAGVDFSITVIMHSLFYVRQFFLAGNQYQLDNMVTQTGENRLRTWNGWYQALANARARWRATQVNMGAPDIDRLKGYEWPTLNNPMAMFNMDTRTSATSMAGTEVMPAWLAYQEYCRGPSTYSLNADLSRENISAWRSCQLEYQGWIAPPVAKLLANGHALAPFTYACPVQSSIEFASPGPGGSAGYTMLMPSTATLTIFWDLAFEMELRAGAGFSTTWAYLQFIGPTTSANAQ